MRQTSPCSSSVSFLPMLRSYLQVENTARHRRKPVRGGRLVFLGTMRCVWVGILCLAVSLAIKPHDGGLVWLYFILAGGAFRKRALQSLVVTLALRTVRYSVAHTGNFRIGFPRCVPEPGQDLGTRRDKREPGARLLIRHAHPWNGDRYYLQTVFKRLSAMIRASTISCQRSLCCGALLLLLVEPDYPVAFLALRRFWFALQCPTLY